MLVKRYGWVSYYYDVKLCWVRLCWVKAETTHRFWKAGINITLLDAERESRTKTPTLIQAIDAPEELICTLPLSCVLEGSERRIVKMQAEFQGNPRGEPNGSP